MKFSSVEQDVQGVLKSGYYSVPRFQRPYSWTREDVEDFWTDTIVGGDSEYFIGSIVLFKENPGRFGVVDGQQRLTTITMLLCAIRNAFKVLSLEGQAKGVQLLVERRDEKTNEKEFVLQTDSSYPFLQEYIQKDGPPDLDVKLGEEEKALREAYDFLTERLHEDVEAARGASGSLKAKNARARKRLERNRDVILQLSLIRVQLDSEDDAYLVFETLNSRGKDLRVSDLVKNLLTKHLKKRNKKVDTARDRWDQVVEIIESSQVSVDVDAFIQHYWVSKDEYVSGKKLFKSIKKEITAAKANSFLDSLVREAPVYRSIFEPSSWKWTKAQAAIRESLDALSIFKVRQAVPMVLAVLASLRDGRIKNKHAKDILSAIETFHFMVTAVTSQSSSGGISQMYASHARGVRNASTLQARVTELAALKNKLRERLPTREDFTVSFAELKYSSTQTKNRALIRYSLGRLARHGLAAKTLDYNALTIEHIVSQSSTAVGQEEIANIGNLVLVSDDLNERLGVKTFSAKKPLFKSAGDTWVDEVLSSADTWSSEIIERRAKALAEIGYDEVWTI